MYQQRSVIGILAHVVFRAIPNTSFDVGLSLKLAGLLHPEKDHTFMLPTSHLAHPLTSY